MRHPQLPLRRHQLFNILLLNLLALLQIAHAIDTLFSQTIPFTVQLGQVYSDLRTIQIQEILYGQQKLDKQSIAQFLHPFDPSKSAGLILTISFTNAIWISDSTSDVTAICALGINKVPYLQYIGGAYQSKNSIIDKKNYLNRGAECQFILNYNKISQQADAVFSTSFQNQISFTIFNTDNFNSLNYSIQIKDFSSDQFTCINDCSGKGQCDVATGECWCQNAWGDTDCSLSMMPLTLSSDYVSFSPTLSYNTLTYYNYPFSYIDDLTFYIYYTLYQADSLKCYFSYEVKNDFKYLPDRWSYDRELDISSGGVNSISKISFTKAELVTAFQDIDTSVQSTFRIIFGCYAASALYSSVSSNSQSILTSHKTDSLRHLSASTPGKLAIKIDNKIQDSDSGSGTRSSFSFIIAASISGGVLLSLLAFVIVCTRRRKKFLMKRQQDALLALNQLQRNNPQLILAQSLFERRNQLAITDLAKAESIKAEKKYFEDIEKYFPCLTLSQVKSYFKQEVPNMKEEDIPKECAICCCDFSEDPLYQSVQGKTAKNKTTDTTPNTPQKQEKSILTLDSQNSFREGANNTKNSQLSSFNKIGNNPNNKTSQETPNLRLITLCNHFFHASCINDWLKKDKSCPHCRQKLGQQELNSISGNVEENVIQRTKRLLSSIKRIKTNGTNNVFSVASRSSFSLRTSPDLNKKSSNINISPQNSPPLLQNQQEQQSSTGTNRTTNKMLDNSVIQRENPSVCEPQNANQQRLLDQHGKDSDTCTDGGEKASRPCGTQETEAQLLTDGKFLIDLNANNNNNLDLLNLLDDGVSDLQKTPVILPKKDDFFNNKDNSTPKTINNILGSNRNSYSNFNFPTGSIFSDTKNLTKSQSSILRLISAEKNGSQRPQNIEMKDFSQHK